eukprot:TRINITY_DN6812_c0_g1_i1.p1 TRINITY_DN6812_c0_g1~~TRINITY_DN6812_c0_g1_i1.p1  ORF type:complete len:404 (+),score=78.52 TRINITY_DN6812_c0_g1_i1:106-1317(+)
MAIVLGGIKAMLSILTTLGLRLPATLVVGNAARPAVLTTIKALLSKLPYLGSLPDIVISSIADKVSHVPLALLFGGSIGGPGGLAITAGYLIMSSLKDSAIQGGKVVVLKLTKQAALRMYESAKSLAFRPALVEIPPEQSSKVYEGWQIIEDYKPLQTPADAVNNSNNSNNNNANNGNNNNKPNNGASPLKLQDPVSSPKPNNNSNKQPVALLDGSVWPISPSSKPNNNNNAAKPDMKPLVSAIPPVPSNMPTSNILPMPSEPTVMELSVDNLQEWFNKMKTDGIQKADGVEIIGHDELNSLLESSISEYPILEPMKAEESIEWCSVSQIEDNDPQQVTTTTVPITAADVNTMINANNNTVAPSTHEDMKNLNMSFLIVDNGATAPPLDVDEFEVMNASVLPK